MVARRPDLHIDLCDALWVSGPGSKSTVGAEGGAHIRLIVLSEEGINEDLRNHPFSFASQISQESI
jgi:hypothetical protein